MPVIQNNSLYLGRGMGVRAIVCCSSFDYIAYISFSFGSLPSLTSKGSDSFLLKRPPVSQNSSQEGLAELASDTVLRGKHLSSSVPSEGMSICGLSPIDEDIDKCIHTYIYICIYHKIVCLYRNNRLIKYQHMFENDKTNVKV